MWQKRERSGIEGAGPSLTPAEAGGLRVCPDPVTHAVCATPEPRVLTRQPFTGAWNPSPRPATHRRYRQMAGRAGRARVDAYGEVILIAGNRVPTVYLRELMAADAAPIHSCLTDDKHGGRLGPRLAGVWGRADDAEGGPHRLPFSHAPAPKQRRSASHSVPSPPFPVHRVVPLTGMRRAMLEVVATGAVRRPADVQCYIRCTLLAAMNSFDVRAGRRDWWEGVVPSRVDWAWVRCGAVRA